MSHFKIGEWGKFRSEFQRLLPNFPIIDLHDGWASMANEYVTINITAFDKMLQQMFPDDWEQMSMEDIIIKHYGLEAKKLIESVL